MKKSKKIIICIAILFISIITVFYLMNTIQFSNKDILKSDIAIYEENNQKTEIDTKVNEEIIDSKPTYIDTNPVKIGIYIQNGNIKSLVTDEYYCNWSPEAIMGLFYVIPTTEPNISTTSFSELWKNYINEYPNPDKYRIGYNIKFTLSTGEVIDRTILNPDNAYYMFPKVMVFLYDDVNLVPGKRYYHITNDEMSNTTICSSIKLVGDIETKNIISPIELTAFCFDSTDDFDENTNKYRGNSSYTITINRK